MAERTTLDAVNELVAKAPAREFSEIVELAINLKDLDLTIPKNRLEDEIPLPERPGPPGEGRALRDAPRWCQKVEGSRGPHVHPRRAR